MPLLKVRRTKRRDKQQQQQRDGNKRNRPVDQRKRGEAIESACVCAYGVSESNNGASTTANF